MDHVVNGGILEAVDAVGSGEEIEAERGASGEGLEGLAFFQDGGCIEPIVKRVKNSGIFFFEDYSVFFCLFEV